MEGNYWTGVFRRRMSRRRALQAAGLSGAGLAAAGLVGCGDDDDDDGGAPATTKDAGQPQSGGTIATAISSDPPTLDVYRSISFNTIIPASFVYSRLLRYKPQTDPAKFFDNEPEGDLALSYEKSQDLSTWTFKLRPGVQFHNGAPFTSEDVKASFERFNSLPAANKAGLGMVDKVETPDPTTAVFKLKEPYSPFATLIASPNYLWIMPKDTGTSFDPTKTMVGSGPFMFDSYESSVALKFKKNPNYFRQGQPYLDGVTIHIIKDTQQRLAQLRTGALHMSHPSVGEQRRDADTVTSARKMQEVPYIFPGMWFFYFQALNPASKFHDPKSPFNDERVRLAVSKAIDRDALLKILYQGNGKWNNYPPVFWKWGVDPKSSEMGALAKNFEFSEAEAKKLLADAGYPNGFDTKLTYALSVYGDIFQQQIELVQNMLNKVGIRVTLNGQDYVSQYISKTFRGEFEGLTFGPQSAFTEVDEFLFNMMHSKSGRNHSTVSDPEMDKLIDAQRKEPTEEGRLKIVRDITKRNAEKMYYVTTVIDNRTQLLQPDVQGYKVGSVYGPGTETFDSLWLKKA